MISRALVVALCIVLLLVSVKSTSDEALLAKLKSAQDAAKETLSSLKTRWHVSEYPNFLTAGSISHTSFEVMKLKLQQKILRRFLNDNASPFSQTFIMSFMGSSVTAGHDSNLNASFPFWTERLMAPAFAKLDITVKARNVAMGNNPCQGYNFCVKTFAGADSDLVHWEQSYNCFDENWNFMFESLIRQSMLLPNRPLVVFTQSDTPNWNEKDCTPAKPAHVVNDYEKELLSTLDKEPIKVLTEVAGKKILGAFGHLRQILAQYKHTGVQVFRHSEYDEYKCLGPYIVKWGCCSASWHPSLLGHELRGSHHAFSWLLVLNEALTELITKKEAPSVLLEEVTKHLEAAHKHFPAHPIHPKEPQLNDEMSCLTDYEPRSERKDDLVSHLVGANPLGGGDGKWTRDIFEHLLPDGINFIKIHRERFGHLDRKWVLFGNKDSGPLSLRITVKKTGVAFLCGPPGEWGKLPDGFENFWAAKTEVYITPNVAKDSSPNDFVFDKSKSSGPLDYTNRKPQDTQTICVDFAKPFPAGDHVLTILPTSEKKTMIGIVVLP